MSQYNLAVKIIPVASQLRSHGLYVAAAGDVWPSHHRSHSLDHSILSSKYATRHSRLTNELVGRAMRQEDGGDGVSGGATAPPMAPHCRGPVARASRGAGSPSSPKSTVIGGSRD